MANTVSSRKAKGRRAQQKLVSLITSTFNLTENDVKSIFQYGPTKKSEEKIQKKIN